MSFISILRPPDRVIVPIDGGFYAMTGGGGGWTFRDIRVSMSVVKGAMHVNLSAPHTPVSRLHLRWQADVAVGMRILGDDWERGYGTLRWQGHVPERVMPWYMLIDDGAATHGYGVKTASASFACWRVDEAGISLWLDVRCGGVGVELGERILTAAEIVARPGVPGETPFQSAQALCRALCDDPRLPDHPVYGSNNWYYAFGDSSHAQILRDTAILAQCAPDGPNRPYMVIDSGWQPRVLRDNAVVDSCSGGPWEHGNARFPDMPALATAITAQGARSGIWIRPLGAAPGTNPHLLLPESRGARDRDCTPTLDPSIPENLARVEADIRRLATWGYQLIKHDFTTYDILGRWGFRMSTDVTNDGWSFADRSRTSAEHILALYRAIRRGAGDDAILIGCNTISHLSAGLVELQRTGDDTSGRNWERTRRMGVNTLAFRMPQHEAFYLADADCVGLTPHVAWERNAQWLDLLARSGTPLFVSTDPAALNTETEEALRRAFARAAHPQPPAEPLDWQFTTSPRHWRFSDEVVSYNWLGPDGVEPMDGDGEAK